jgi:hypothetical protein
MLGVTSKVSAPVEKQNRHRSVPGMVKRLRRYDILDRVRDLGAMSDVAVLKSSRKEDLVRNLAFAIYQQRLWGALDRLKRQFSMGTRLPHRVASEMLKNAARTIEEAGK